MTRINSPLRKILAPAVGDLFAVFARTRCGFTRAIRGFIRSQITGIDGSTVVGHLLTHSSITAIAVSVAPMRPLLLIKRDLADLRVEVINWNADKMVADGTRPSAEPTLFVGRWRRLVIELQEMKADVEGDIRDLLAFRSLLQQPHDQSSIDNSGRMTGAINEQSILLSAAEADRISQIERHMNRLYEVAKSICCPCRLYDGNWQVVASARDEQGKTYGKLESDSFESLHDAFGNLLGKIADRSMEAPAQQQPSTTAASRPAMPERRDSSASAPEAAEAEHDLEAADGEGGVSLA